MTAPKAVKRCTAHAITCGHTCSPPFTPPLPSFLHHFTSLTNHLLWVLASGRSARSFHLPTKRHIAAILCVYLSPVAALKSASGVAEPTLPLSRNSTSSSAPEIPVCLTNSS